jgi:hypothetical protein
MSERTEPYTTTRMDKSRASTLGCACLWFASLIPEENTPRLVILRGVSDFLCSRAPHTKPCKYDLVTKLPNCDSGPPGPCLQTPLKHCSNTLRQDMQYSFEYSSNTARTVPKYKLNAARIRPNTPEYMHSGVFGRSPNTPEYTRIRPNTCIRAYSGDPRIRPNTPEYARIRPNT